MILMALDHVRDFIHHEAMTGASPTNLATTTPILFLTRWVTHFCAPIFIFTAGLGAWLWSRRGYSRAQLAGFLATRGLWLILLELTVMQLAYNFSVSAQYPMFLLVLWVLGASMVGLAAWIWLPTRVVMVAALMMIALHNLLDPIQAGSLGSAAGLWNLLHQVGAFRLADRIVIVGYPIVPWVAVMAFGFACGPIFERPAEERQRWLRRAGVVAAIGFVVVRGLNGYGDPIPWAGQASGVMTALSFLNVTKYPPSLAFLLMTLGPSLLALAWLDRRGLPASHPLVVLGRAPLFFFVAHFFLAHAAAVVLAWLRYGAAASAFTFYPLPSMGGPRELYPPDYGFDLWVVYLVWAAIVIALYPACRWFADLKSRRREWWVSYL